ncbi:MAG: tetratricopeptide repeat protein [Rhodospirillales bacterium]|nr:tetratricopeptide repeat protein [Rhodospirillales bacterium]
MRTRTSSPGPAKAGNSAATPRLLADAVQRHREGRLAEAAELYRRILALQPKHPDALHLLGLVEHARGAHADSLKLIERAIAINGRIAAFHTARGTVLAALGRGEAAFQALTRALALEPRNPEALNTLGNLRLSSGDAVAAEDAYRQALAAKPEYAEALSNLGSALRAQGRLADAEAALREAIRLRPSYATALANLGLVLQEQARWAEALATYDRALAPDSRHPAAHGNRSMLLLLLGRLEEGFAEYEWRWQMPDFATPRRDFPQPLWNGERLSGETLLVHAEQGLGSAIQFVRYVKPAAAMGARIVLECQPPLLRLFRQSLAGPGEPVAEVIIKGEALPPFDRQVPLMSLPHLLGTTLSTIPAGIPYLRADEADIAVWRGRLASAPRPRIGLVWAGNRRHENDHNRSLPATGLAPLVSRFDAAFFSLQVPVSPSDLACFPAGRLVDYAPLLTDFADTAAALAALDLVITVDTAAAHLAGALGRPGWLLLPFVPEWRWLLDREDSPWYPSLRLFRQRSPGDWDEVIERVAAALPGWAAQMGSR